MSLRGAVIGQFRRPHGWLGRLAGWIMASRPSNLERSRWTLDLLEIAPGQRVLEIGCGPGVALADCVDRVGQGRVVGVDHSEVMIAQAERRLREALAAGRVELRLGGLELLDGLAMAFDRIYSVNVMQFLPDLDDACARIHAALVPDGVAATTYQPREQTPTREAALAMAERIERAMAAAGFEEIRREELALEPAPAICVLGRRR